MSVVAAIKTLASNGQHTDHATSRTMNIAIWTLSLLATAIAEAPYYINRPAPNVPSLNYHPQVHLQQRPPPIPVPPQPIQYPQQNFNPISGYQYQQPNINPVYIQPPLPISPGPQIQISQQLPQPPSNIYGSPLLRQIQPQQFLRQQQLPLQQQPQQIITQQPQAYSAPQASINLQQQQLPLQQPIGIQGYSNQNSQVNQQSISQSPLQHSAFTSYQADNNAYATNHSPLDSIVVDRVQNILKENEHSAARNAGYISLVSGVSLEKVTPSIEISSFIHNSPINVDTRDSGIPIQGLARSSSGQVIQNTSSVAAIKSPANGYGLPSANTAQSSQGQISSNFLPQPQLSNSYGTPN